MLLAMVLFRPATCCSNGALAVFRLTPTWFTAVDDEVQAFAQLFLGNVMLILADTNRFRIDLHHSGADPADGAMLTALRSSTWKSGIPHGRYRWRNKPKRPASLTIA